MKKHQLLDLINWDAVLAAPRYAGGHSDVMAAIFEGNAKVLCHYTENDYQGTLAIAYQFPDGGVAIVTDYFGSCSGCDSWEDASDDSARLMVTSLVTSARLFDTVEEAREFCKGAKSAEDYPFEAAQNLSF
jgi:hypothetical protein